MRLTLKATQRGRRLIRTDIEVDAMPTDEDLREAAVAAAAVLTRRKTHRLGPAAREGKSEALSPPIRWTDEGEPFVDVDKLDLPAPTSAGD